MEIFHVIRPYIWKNFRLFSYSRAKHGKFCSALIRLSQKNLIFHVFRYPAPKHGKKAGIPSPSFSCCKFSGAGFLSLSHLSSALKRCFFLILPLHPWQDFISDHRIFPHQKLSPPAFLASSGELILINDFRSSSASLSKISGTRPFCSPVKIHCTLLLPSRIWLSRTGRPSL